MKYNHRSRDQCKNRATCTTPSVFRDFEALMFLCCVCSTLDLAQLHLLRSVECRVPTTVPGTVRGSKYLEYCTQRGICTGRYDGKTDDVCINEFDGVSFFFACALNSKLCYSRIVTLLLIPLWMMPVSISWESCLSLDVVLALGVEIEELSRYLLSRRSPGILKELLQVVFP
jgi:hypothetical protein